MDIHERLMAAMQAIDVLERDVRSTQAATRAQSGAENGQAAPETGNVKNNEVATANLKLVLERRKALGRLWSMDIKQMKREVDPAEVGRLLAPLSLGEIRLPAEIAQDDDGIEKQAMSKEKRVARNVIAGGYAYGPDQPMPQYRPAKKMFDPADAIERATRNKATVEEADEDDDAEESGSPFQRALSVGSTGSNITVYRPPSVDPGEALNDVDGGTQQAAPSTSDKPAGKSITGSELSFATSTGSGLFVSDKKRPKKLKVAIAPGGNSTIAPFASNEGPATPPKKSTRKRKAIDDLDATPKSKGKKKEEEVLGTAEPGEPTPRRRMGKGNVDVVDLVSETSGRRRASRATMTDGEGLLVGISGFTVEAKEPPRSWQGKGRGKGVTRPVQLNEMKGSAENDKK